MGLDNAKAQSSSTFDYRAASVPELLAETLNNSRDAHLEISRRFANGTGQINSNKRAALRHYSIAARMGYPGIGALPPGTVPVVRAEHGSISVPNPTQPVAIIVADSFSSPAPFAFSASHNSVTSGPDLYFGWRLGDESAVFDSPALDVEYWQAGNDLLTLVVMDSEGRIDIDVKLIDILVPQFPPAATSLHSPAASTQNSYYAAQEFSWVVSPTATSYQLDIVSANNGTPVFSGVIYPPDYCDQSLCRYLPQRGLSGLGDYNWQVAAVNAAGATWSAGRQLVIELPDAVEICPYDQNDTNRFRIQNMPQPDYLLQTTDSLFGSPITRITNSQSGEITRHVYSSMQAWNTDESRLLMYHSDESEGQHWLLDGQTYVFQSVLDVTASDIEDIFWSYHDPDILYYFPGDAARRGEFVEHNVVTGQEHVLADFSSQCAGGVQPDPGNDIQMHAVDNDLFSFRCGSDTDQAMFGFRISDGSIVSASLGDDSQWYPWIAPVPLSKGDGFYLNGSVLSTDLQPSSIVLDMGNFFEHSSTGIGANGENMIYQVSYGASPTMCGSTQHQGIGQLIMHNLETGSCQGVVTSAQGYPYPASNTHVSATAYKQPGWVALSSVGNGDTQIMQGLQDAPALFSEIVLVNTDAANRTVCRLAHHRSYAGYAQNATYNKYFGEPHATLSPSGTRILFASDWYDSGSINAYVIDLR